MIFLSLGKKITKIKKFKDLPTIVVKLNLTSVQFTYLFPFFLLLFSSNLTIVYNSFPPRRKQPRTSINAFISFARILNYDVVNSER